jgi:threonine synthase
MRCAVILPAGKIASGKMAQAFAYGARIVAIDGNFDQALEIVRALGQRGDFAVVNSINPDRIAGQKTAAFEIVDEQGDAPDLHLLPVGNAGNITAYWSGYEAFRAAGKATRSPRMIGFQAEGAAPIFRGEIVVRPETVATAIRIGNPASWAEANCAIKESGGMIDIVSDEEILDAQRWLASAEGIFVEPASAAPIAGLLRACDLKNARALTRRRSRKDAESFCSDRSRAEGSRRIATTSHAAVEPNESAVRRAEKLELTLWPEWRKRKARPRTVQGGWFSALLVIPAGASIRC